MSRKLIAISVSAGLAASVPLIYQTNPDMFHGLATNAMTQLTPVAEPEKPVPVVNLAALPGQKQLTGRRVELIMGGRGHFTGEFKINGRRVDAMVDTGATLVAINESMARRFGITLSPADFRYRIDTANGVALAAAVDLEALEIGRIRVEGVKAVVLQDRALSDVLIGMSFLNQLGKFQVENGKMLLEQ